MVAITRADTNENAASGVGIMWLQVPARMQVQMLMHEVEANPKAGANVGGAP